MLNLFVTTIKVSSSQWRRNELWTEKGSENIKYKFRFAPKLPTICINRKCSIGVRSSQVVKSKYEGLGEETPALDDFGD